MKTETPVKDLYLGKKKVQVLNGKKWEPSNFKISTEHHLSRVITSDLILLNACFFSFMAIQVSTFQLLVNHVYSLLVLFTLVNLVWLFMTPFTDIYRNFEGIKLDLKISYLFWGALFYFGMISLVYYQFFFSVFQVHFLIPSFVTFLVLSSLMRYAIRYYNGHRTEVFSYAVIGGDNSNLRYLEEVFESIYGKYAFCVGRFAPYAITGVINLGGYDDIEDYIRNNHGINKLLYFYSNLSKKEVQRIIQLCRSRFIDFEVVPAGIDFFEKGVQVEQLVHLPIFRRQKEPLCQLKNKIIKRTFDLVFSFLVIITIFPWLFPIVALLIKLESKGPVFFIQKRTGYWNKPFNCVKFRTMRVNDRSGLQQATKGDPRITRIGAFLRKTNIDEFPQFLNVLTGNMSVVGPRPHMLKHTEDFSKLIDKFMIRHEVKPGITGWAQVSGWRGPTEEVNKMVKRVEHDVYYIENWSFWFDCKCIFLTVFNMIKGEENAL